MIFFIVLLFWTIKKIELNCLGIVEIYILKDKQLRNIIFGLYI
jgi:hypothetical protein